MFRSSRERYEIDKNEKTVFVAVEDMHRNCITAYNNVYCNGCGDSISAKKSCNDKLLIFPYYKSINKYDDVSKKYDIHVLIEANNGSYYHRIYMIDDKVTVKCSFCCKEDEEEAEKVKEVEEAEKVKEAESIHEAESDEDEVESDKQTYINNLRLSILETMCKVLASSYILPETKKNIHLEMMKVLESIVD